MFNDAMREAFGPEYLGWLAVLLVVVLGAATAEGLVKTYLRRESYDWKAYFSSLADMAGRRGVEAIGLSLAAPAMAFAYAHRINTIELSGPLAFLLLFIGQDFCYYWYHRTSHRVGWFWANHSVHHSPNELTLATAVRLGWTGKLAGNMMFYAPLVWLGFSPTAVIATYSANLLYQFWLHAPWMPKLGWFELIFNTPTHHKVHHASNPEYLDCNYGGVLIVFDRMFGSFVDLKDDVEPIYGLTTPLTTNNPVKIAFHGWINLGRDLMAAKTWKNRALVLVGPPGALAKAEEAAAHAAANAATRDAGHTVMAELAGPAR